MSTLVTETLQHLHAALGNELIWLNAKWSQFENVFGAPQVDLDILNATAPGFFFQARDAMLDDILLSICRITDPAKNGTYENLSLGQLAQHREIGSLPGLATEVSALVHAARDKAKFARQLRNKRLAHRDLLTALRLEEYPLLKYKRCDVRTALAAIAAVLNRVRRHLAGGDGNYGEIIGYGDSHRLFQYLRAGLQADRARLKALGISEPSR